MVDFDPIDEAARQWTLRWGGPRGDEGAVPAMHAVTSLMRVHQLVSAELDAMLKPFGLTFARYEALVLLTFSSRGSLPLGKMGERLQVHPTSITSIIQRLAAAGLVARLPHPDDRRTVLAEITPAGRELVERATAVLTEARFGLAALDEAALLGLSELLRPVRRAAGDGPDSSDGPGSPGSPGSPVSPGGPR
jgi:DNA-binding MarR family transcriptional regulator